MSFTNTHLKSFENILKKYNVISHEFSFKKESTFDIYVIDMQNGFMPDGECGVLDSECLPDMICNYLDYMTSYINKLNNKINIRYIFSRDYHHPKHHSFGINGFPPHCRYGTNSSMLHPTIMDWIKKNSDKNIVITFKGYHPHIESFSALAYTDTYDASKRQGACCEAHKQECENKNPLICGGGVVFPKMSLDKLLTPNPFVDDIELINDESSEDTIDINAEKTLTYMLQNGVPLIQQFHEKISYSFVVGLAGDFCVRDTLINAINQKMVQKQKGETCLVYNLTSYVTLPIGTCDSEDIMDEHGMHIVTPKKDEMYYVWISNIEDLVLDYIESGRNVCLKSPLFVKYVDNKMEIYKK